jgi:hypothetical protein
MQGKEDRQTAVVVERTYDFRLWLLPKVEKFPRSFRRTRKLCPIAAGLRARIRRRGPEVPFEKVCAGIALAGLIASNGAVFTDRQRWVGLNPKPGVS